MITRLRFYSALLLSCLFLCSVRIVAQNATTRDNAIENAASVLFDMNRDYLRYRKIEFERNFGVDIRFNVQKSSLDEIGGLSEYLLKIYQSVTQPIPIIDKTISGEFSFLNNGKLSDTLIYETKCSSELENCLLSKSVTIAIDNSCNRILKGVSRSSNRRINNIDTIGEATLVAIGKYTYAIYSNRACPEIFKDDRNKQQESVLNTTRKRSLLWSSSISAMSQELYLRHENLIGGALQTLNYDPRMAAINVYVRPNEPAPEQVINLNGSVDECTRLDLESRARLVFAKTNIRYFFLSQTVEFFIPSDSLQIFGDSICAKLFNVHSDKSFIVALWIKCTDSITNRVHGQMLVRQNGKWLTEEEIEFACYGGGGDYSKNTISKFNAVIKNIPKPLIVCYQVARAEGIFSTAYFLQSKNQKGYEQVYYHVFKRDRLLDEINDLISALKISNVPNPRTGEIDVAHIDYLSGRLKMLRAKAALEPDLETVPLQFKEVYLQDSNIVFKAAEEYLQSKYNNIFHHRRRTLTEQAISMPYDLRVGTCKLNEVKENIEQTLAFSSGALSLVGLDFIPDALSVMYYAYEGDAKGTALAAVSLGMWGNAYLLKLFDESESTIVKVIEHGAAISANGTELISVSPELPLFSDIFNLPPQTIGEEFMVLIRNNPVITRELLLIEDAEARLIRRLNEVPTEQRRELLHEFYYNEALRNACIKDADEVVKWTRSVAKNAISKKLSGYLKTSFEDFIAKGLYALEEGGKIKLFDEYDRFLIEISEGKIRYKYGGYGGDIVISEGKATTVLGKFAEVWGEAKSFGTRLFLGSDADVIVKGFPKGTINRGVDCAVPNRLNFLDLPEFEYNSLLNIYIKEEFEKVLGVSSNIQLGGFAIKDVRKIIQASGSNLSSNQLETIITLGKEKGNQVFWEKYNLPFLRKAFERGDDVRLVSDYQFYRNASNEIGGTYKAELVEIEKLAVEFNYSWNEATLTYSKF